MTEITPTELQDQLYETIAILAAPSDQQIAYVDRMGLPIDELHSELDAAAHSFIGRLRENDLIDETVELDIADLLRMMDSMNGTEMWQPQSLNKPEWVALRQRARSAVVSFDRLRQPQLP